MTTKWIGIILFLCALTRAQAAPPVPSVIGAGVIAGIQAPVLPTGNASIAAAITNVMQFGPEVWVPTLQTNPTTPYLLLTYPGSPGPGAPPLFQTMSPIEVPIPRGYAEISSNVATSFPGPLESFGVGIGAFTVSATTANNSIFSLSGLLSPIGQNLNALPFMGPPPSPNVLPATLLSALGMFTASATANDPALLPAQQRAVSWAQDYFFLYNYLTNNTALPHLATPMGIYPTSRGRYFFQQLVSYLGGSLPADAQYFLRQLYFQNRQKVASFRAIGLNPMWAADIPNTNPVVLPGVSDYLLNSTAKFLYYEGSKHHGGTAAATTYDLLLKVFAASLAYESGLIQTRYAPFDPSCRFNNPPPTPPQLCNVALSIADWTANYTELNNDANFNAAVAPSLPNLAALLAPLPGPNQGILKAPFLQSFGVASDFVVAYDVIKFFAGSPTTARAIANEYVAGGTSPTLRAKYSAALGGIPYPNSAASIMTAAKALFDSAMAIWNALPALPSPQGQVQAYWPRPSAAIIAAATLTGNRVDPTFWGPLAEAEQAVMKNHPDKYVAWADSVLTIAVAPNPSTIFTNDLNLALSPFGSFRGTTFNGVSPNVVYPQQYVSPDLTGVGLQKLFLAATDPVTSDFALVRSPMGLDSLTSDHFELASQYSNGATPPVINPTLYPNAYLEVAGSGHAIIDGRLLYTTDGKVAALDLDYSKANAAGVANKLMPFEILVDKAYQRIAATELSTTAAAVTVANLPSKVAGFAALKNNTAGNANPAEVPAWAYSVNTGSFKPVSASASDKRFFQPSLEFWLVTADKLSAANMGSTGLTASVQACAAGAGLPPCISSLGFMPFARTNYTLMNLDTITIQNAIDMSGAAASPNTPDRPETWRSNMISLDGYHQISNPGVPAQDFATNNNWSKLVMNLNNSILGTATGHPFISPTNNYLYKDPSMPPLVTVTAAGVANPIIPATTGDNYTCTLFGAYPRHDLFVNCP